MRRAAIEQYILEFKQDALRLAEGDQSTAAISRTLNLTELAFFY